MLSKKSSQHIFKFLACTALSAALVLAFCVPALMPTSALAEGEENAQAGETAAGQAQDESARATNAKGAGESKSKKDKKAATKTADAAKIKDAKTLQKQADAIADALYSMTNDLEMTSEDIAEIEGNISKLEKQQKDLEKEVEKAKNAHERAQQSLDAAVNDIYRNDYIGMFSVVVGAESLDDFVTRTYLVEKVIDDREKALADAQAAKERLEKEQAKLAANKKEQENLRSQAQAKGESMASYATAQASALSNLDSKMLKKVNDLDDRDSSAVRKAVESARSAAERHGAAASAVGGASGALYVYIDGSTSKAGSHAKAASLAKGYLGVKYVWGGETPSGFDCSGLTKYVYAKLGISLPHSARQQFDCGTHIAKSALMPGDLVFFGSSKEGIHHVGIYIGGGKYIHAPRTGDVVKISKLSNKGSFIGACRPGK